MSTNWKSVIDRTEQWPTLRTRSGAELASDLRESFIEYVDKTVHWLDYFVMDPNWLNLTAVNYAANVAREAANEVRQVRMKFEEEYELTRDDLAANPLKPETGPGQIAEPPAARSTKPLPGNSAELTSDPETDEDERDADVA